MVRAVLLVLVSMLLAPWSPVATNSVPAFLKLMVDQAEGHEVALAASGSWHPMARSVAPLRTVAGPNSLTMQFHVPNDDWSLAGRRVCLLVLSPRPLPDGGHGVTSVTVAGSGDESWRLSERLTAGKQFLQFNLTKHVDPRRQKQLNLELSAWDEQGRSVAPGDAVVVGGVTFGPLLVVTEPGEVSPPPVTRKRRTLTSYLPHALPGCRLEHWAVNAVQLGWSQIVYPQRLLLNLCVGQCPQPVLHDSLKPSNHAVARNLYKSRNSHASFTHPDIQCVPIRFRSTSLVLEQEEGNYTVVTSDDLSAVDCGCR